MRCSTKSSPFVKTEERSRWHRTIPPASVRVSEARARYRWAKNLSDRDHNAKDLCVMGCLLPVHQCHICTRWFCASHFTPGRRVCPYCPALDLKDADDTTQCQKCGREANQLATPAGSRTALLHVWNRCYRCGLLLCDTCTDLQCQRCQGPCPVYADDLSPPVPAPLSKTANDLIERFRSGEIQREVDDTWTALHTSETRPQEGQVRKTLYGLSRMSTFTMQRSLPLGVKMPRYQR